MGPFWLTGGGYGIDASWWACLILVMAFPVVYSATRDLDYLYNAPVIEPRGMAVDLDSAARWQHESAMGETAAAAAPPLVQILPASTSPGQPKPASESSVDREEMP